MKALSLLLCALLTSSVNAATPAKPATEAEKIAIKKKVLAMKDLEFCLAFGKSVRETKTNPPTEYSRAMLDRATNLEHVKYQEIAAVQAQTPAIGLSMCGMIAALGRSTRTHQYTRASGTSFQVIYDRGERNIYLHLDFVENDFRVTSWSN